MCEKFIKYLIITCFEGNGKPQKSQQSLTQLQSDLGGNPLGLMVPDREALLRVYRTADGCCIRCMNIASSAPLCKEPHGSKLGSDYSNFRAAIEVALS